MLSTITLAGNDVTLVPMPATPGFESIELSMFDAVAIVNSPFTGQMQAQQWPGADMWTGTVTMPKLRQAYADQWISFLMQCRGMANAFQVGDPLKAVPAGTPLGTPVANGAVTMAAGGQTLYTRGWKANSFRLLMQGDYLQLGYRLHRVLDVVNSDATGSAAIAIWPSLREVPADGQQVIVSKARGLFRLASNKRTWSADWSRMTSMSFPIMEYR